MAKNNNNPEEKNQGLDPQEISQEQIAKWKKEHKVDAIHKISVKRKDGSYAVAWLKDADRNVSALALSKLGGQKIQEAGAVLLDNCWLSGDSDIKTDDKLFVSACQEAWAAFELPEAKSEKF